MGSGPLVENSGDNPFSLEQDGVRLLRAGGCSDCGGCGEKRGDGRAIEEVEDGGSSGYSCNLRGGSKGRGWEASDNGHWLGSSSGDGGNRRLQQQWVLCFCPTKEETAGDTEGS